MNKAIKLLDEATACPFCGDYNMVYLDKNAVNFWVVCGKCESCGPANKNAVKAVELWNSRVAVELIRPAEKPLQGKKMKIEFSKEEMDRLVKSIKTSRNFCKRTISQEGILPDYKEFLMGAIEEYDKLLEKFVQSADKVS